MVGDEGREGAGTSRSLVLVLLLALAVQLPTLWVGFFADDYGHQLALRSAHTPIPRWNLYDFRDFAAWQGFEQELGALPWWTSADWKVRFFRPLTSLSLVLDHALWADWAPGYHATSLVLWVLVLLLVQRLFLALGFSARAAWLALLVFALSDASAVPVGWIANRNALLETLFATGAALLALRGPGPPRRATIAGALALAFLAALSKESGAFAFVLVALVLLARGRKSPSRPAFLGAAIAVLLFTAHLGFLAWQGYGTQSLFYATPWLAPARFLGNMALLVTGGVLSFFGPFPLDAALALPELAPWLPVVGLLVGWPLAVWVLRAVRGEPGFAFLCAWTALFLLPQSGATSADRLLFSPSIGAAGLLALFWVRERARWREASRPRRALVVTVGLAATLGSGFSLVMQNISLAGMAGHIRAKALATDVGPRELGPRDVFVLQAESQMQAFTLGETWHAELGDRDVHFALLQGGTRPVRWTRVDERAFELESLGLPFLTAPFESVYLSSAAVPAPGTRFERPFGAVEALAADATGLRKIRVTLTRSLDDEHVRFVVPVEGVLTRIAPPAIGRTLELPAPIPSRPFVP